MAPSPRTARCRCRSARTAGAGHARRSAARSQASGDRRGRCRAQPTRADTGDAIALDSGMRDACACAVMPNTIH
eukprot:355368-Chlamydomonas_euryale.AAC.5